MTRSLFSTAAAALLLLVVPLATADHTLPKISKEFTDNFEDKFVAGVKSPTDMYFTPDDKYAFVTSKFGKIWRISVEDMDNNKGVPEEVFEIPHPMCLNGARGLGGIAVHPEYPSKPYIYVFHNHDKYDDCVVSTELDEGPVNRMSRWTLNSDLKSVDPNSEVVFFETSRLGTQTHNSGDIAFGADGMVYVTVGESGSKKEKNANGEFFPLARNVLLGSVVRLDEDGNIPSDNPFTPAMGDKKAVRCNKTGMSEDANANCQEIYMTGFRNPFRFAMDPNAAKQGKTRFFVNDVGSNTWEMIKEGGDGMGGVNYGYPLREGPCEGGQDTKCEPDDRYQVPTYSYHHVDEHGGAITGGTFVPDDAGWPSSLSNSYLYAEYAISGIYAITPDENERCDYPKCDPPVPAYKQQAFSDKKKVVGLSFGPHKGKQAMYYIVHLPSGRDGEGINRISFSGSGNRDPKASIEASTTVGFLPFTVSFDGTKSFDPDDGDTDNLTYEWDFDDDGRVDSTDAKPSFEFTKAGVFNAKLTVRDGNGGSDSTTIRIDADNSPPGPRIISPFPGTSFAVGDKIVLRGEAFDAEDGQLPDSALSWEVRQHHNNHYHPFLDPTTGNNIEIDPAPPPEDFFEYTTTRSYLAIHLTATDSAGLSSTTVLEIHPRMVNLEFDSKPSGMTILLNAEKFTTPVSLVGWEGHKFEIEAPVQKSPDGSMMSLKSWSEGMETGVSTADYTVPVDQPSQPIMATFHASRPVPVIKSIDSDFVFSVGDSFELDGDAFASDGVTRLSDSALTWEVRLYNVDADDYVTLLAPTKGNKLSMPTIPEPNSVVFNHANGLKYGKDAAEYNSPDAAGLGYLEVILSATDESSGKTDTTRLIVEPDIVEISVDTVPSGIDLRVDNQMVTTPAIVSTWRDHSFNVKAVGGQFLNDKKYEWVQWSNGKSRSHKVKARKDDSIVAEFEAVESLPVPEISGYREGRDTFKAGEEFVLSGSGYTAHGKELPYYALSWTVRLYSGGMDGTDMTSRQIAKEKGRDLYFEIPAPESFQESETGFIEVVLKAEDERDGLSSTKTLIMQPSHVDVTLESEPSGLFVMANGEKIKTPTTITTWQKQVIQLDSPWQQKKKGDIYTWWSWSDEEGNSVYKADHSYIVPRPRNGGEPRVITATFGVGASPYVQSAQDGSSSTTKIGIVVAALVAVVLAIALGAFLIYRKNKGIAILDVSDNERSVGDDFKVRSGAAVDVDRSHTTDDSHSYHNDETFRDNEYGLQESSSVSSGPSSILSGIASSIFGDDDFQRQTTKRDNRSRTPENLLVDDGESSVASDSIASEDPYSEVIMGALSTNASLEDYEYGGDVGLDTVSDTTSMAGRSDW
eukprot:CAMPEP_0178535294 /NCGR_PEP_ID=MMETSP0696-20121128/35469_1 /TAXON_ID=265572 /ORGANISM="Extubocellulus spinifer, Strain CCMP396" /LENGTH=1360 /DNA_ID=CAMNT_0020167425 /DNA_START=360 /DNA_END=4442 /DNA_ORIENTATION=+